MPSSSSLFVSVILEARDPNESSYDLLLLTPSSTVHKDSASWSTTWCLFVLGGITTELTGKYFVTIKLNVFNFRCPPFGVAHQSCITCCPTVTGPESSTHSDVRKHQFDNTCSIESKESKKWWTHLDTPGTCYMFIWNWFLNSFLFLCFSLCSVFLVLNAVSVLSNWWRCFLHW